VSAGLPEEGVLRSHVSWLRLSSKATEAWTDRHTENSARRRLVYVNQQGEGGVVDVKVRSKIARGWEL
jgi:hypothetical protein